MKIGSVCDVKGLAPSPLGGLILVIFEIFRPENHHDSVRTIASKSKINLVTDGGLKRRRST